LNQEIRIIISGFSFHLDGLRRLRKRRIKVFEAQTSFIINEVIAGLGSREDA